MERKKHFFVHNVSNEPAVNVSGGANESAEQNEDRCDAVIVTAAPKHQRPCWH